MLRTVIIDDEKPARELIENYLAEYCPDVEVVAKASSVKTGFNAIKKASPDFIFLDIEMADGKGFDLLSMFDKIDFRIIFVTAWSEYAIKAFRFSALDYLLKPVKIDELVDAVEKVRILKTGGTGKEMITALFENLRSGPMGQPTIIVPHLKGFEVLKVNEIIMCQADGYCTNIYLSGNRKIVSSRNLKHFAGLLEDHDFFRVHHSYLVNKAHISSFTRQGEIFLSEGLRAFIGDSYKNAFLKHFSVK